MSNYVYGYVKHTTNNNAIKSDFVKLFENEVVGFKETEVESLIGFPSDLIQHNEQTFSFEITDTKFVTGAQYLLDSDDFVEGVDLELPLRGSERFAILLRMLENIVKLPNVTSLVIGLVDCGIIEGVKDLSEKNFTEIIQRDFATYDPPNIVYNICK